MVAGAVLLQRTFVEPLQGACTIPLLHTPWPIVRRPDTEPVLARAGVAGEPQAVSGGGFSLQASGGFVSLLDVLLTPRL